MELNAALGNAAGITIDGESISRPKLLARSVDHAQQVVSEAEALLEYYLASEQRTSWRRLWRRKPPTSAERRLRGFLEKTLRPSAELVLAGALREQQQAVQADKAAAPARKLAEMDRLSYRAYYNLACYEASQGRDHAVPPDRENFEVALDDLRQALRRVYGARRAELIRWARLDPSFAALNADATYGRQFRDILARYEIAEERTEAAPTETSASG